MQPIKSGSFEWDITELCNALRLSEGDCREFGRDGRLMSFLVERRLTREVFCAPAVSSRTCAYDIRDNEGLKWEVRSVTKHGTAFSASCMRGAGRQFDEQRFLSDLQTLDGFVLVDVTFFPRAYYWIIPVSRVRYWWTEGLLGKNAILGYKAIQKLLLGCALKEVVA